MPLSINEPPKCMWAAWQPPCSHILLVPRGENKWMLHLWGLCEDSRWHLFFLYWQVLYRWNRQSSTSVIETNKTSVELSLPFDEDYIIEIKPFSDGGDGSSSEQIRIPKISSKSVFFLPYPSLLYLLSLANESGLGQCESRRESLLQKRAVASPSIRQLMFADHRRFRTKDDLTSFDWFDQLPIKNQIKTAPNPSHSLSHVDPCGLHLQQQQNYSLES